MFKKILADYQEYIQMREQVIKKSRKILKLSKQAIFNLHRDKKAEAGKELQAAENILLELKQLFGKEKKLNYEGSYRECAEEYVEAKLFYEFINSGQVKIDSKIKFCFEDYLGGISDLTGEMVRKTVQLATKGEYKKIDDYYMVMENIMAELIKFDLTGRLRMKYDAAKRNMRRLEDIRYEIKIKGLS